MKRPKSSQTWKPFEDIFESEISKHPIFQVKLTCTQENHQNSVYLVVNSSQNLVDQILRSSSGSWYVHTLKVDRKEQQLYLARSDNFITRPQQVLPTRERRHPQIDYCSKSCSSLTQITKWRKACFDQQHYTVSKEKPNQRVQRGFYESTATYSV